MQYVAKRGTTNVSAIHDGSNGESEGHSELVSGGSSTTCGSHFCESRKGYDAFVSRSFGGGA